MKETNLLKNTMYLTIGSLGTKLINFMIVPIYTYYLSTSQMGAFDLFETAKMFLIPILSLMVSDGIYRWMIESDNKVQIIYNGLSIITKFIILCTIIYFSLLLFIRVDFPILYYLCIISAVYYGIFSNITRGFQNNFLYSISGILYTLVLVSSNVVQIIILNNSVKGLLISQLLANILITFFLIIVQKNEFKNIFNQNKNVKLRSSILHFSLPLIPDQVNWWVVNASNRIFIKLFMGLSYNGIFSISCKFPSVIDIFNSVFTMAWTETAILKHNSADSQKEFTEIFDNVMRISLSIGILAIPATFIFIILFIDNSYHGAVKYLGLLYAGSVYHIFANFFGVGYTILKETKKLMYSSAIAAIVNVLINVLLIKYFGLYAASFSTFLAYFCIFLIRFRDTNFLFKIKIDFKIFILLNMLLILTIFCSALTSVMINFVILIIDLLLLYLINYKFIKLLIYKYILRR